MIVTIALILGIAAVLAPLILRDLERAVRRQRLRKLLAPHVAAFRAFQVAIGTALLPVMREMARAVADAQESMRKVAAVMNREGK